MGNIGVRGLDHARASARSTGMFLAALVIALCALMTGAHDAYAITVRDDGNGYRRAIVYPHDYPDGRYAALTEFLGYDWNSFSQQTKTAIIEDDGKFMELYRARCKNYRYENENLQDGTGSVIGALSTKLAEVVDAVSGAVFGNDKTWYCSCTDADYDAARENIEQWLYPNDGTGGSGSGGSTVAGIETYALNRATTYSGSFTEYANGNVTVDNTGKTVLSNLSGATNKSFNNYSNITVGVDSYLKQRLNDKATSENLNVDKYYICYGAANRLLGGTNSIILVGVDSTKATSEITSTGIKITRVGNTTDTCIVWAYSASSVCVDGVFYCKDNYSVNVASLISSSTREYTTYYINTYDGAGGGGGGEPYEPTPDPTPTPPVIQIGDVTVDLSNGPYTVNNVTYTAVLDNDNNWTVQVTTNTTNNYGGDVQAVDPTDYTSILNAILAAINSLRSELTTYTNQINSNITTAINSLNNSIKNVETTLKNKLDAFKQQMHQDIQTLQENLQNNFNGKMDAYTTQLWSNMAALDADLLEAIYNAGVYIVDGLQFDGGWDDDEIVKWLKLIYSRVKDKKVTVRSVDEDPKGWLDDLKRVLDELLNVILSGLNVATLATAFEGLKTRFPISIPWDIAAIVNMFAGGAVTPVFDLPLPNGDGTLTMVHVDLHEWDDEMALVRQGELLLFGIALMYNTKWMFDTITTTFRRGD